MKDPNLADAPYSVFLDKDANGKSVMFKHPVTFTNGQVGDKPREVILPFAKDAGYDGIEVACGSIFDVYECMNTDGYCEKFLADFAANNLKCWAIGGHCVGQAVLDPTIDKFHKGILPKRLYENASSEEEIRKNCIEEMKNTARAAQKIGAKIVTGFTGSSIWQYVYAWPPVGPVDPEYYNDGFKLFYDRWTPILDVFGECGVKFALEVHPTEIAFDYYSAERALEAIKGHPAFGFNYDPSHLLWQGVDPADFIYAFPDRIFHAHLKDVKIRRNGRNGLLGSHIGFGDSRRAWNFCSLGRGDVNFEEVYRALKHIGYKGPLSVEWEDNDMDGLFGLAEACKFVRKLQFSFGGGFEDALGGDH